MLHKLHLLCPIAYTLLALDLDDEVAWQELIAQYRRFIPYVLRGMGVPVDDVDDLPQQILVRHHAITRSRDRVIGVIGFLCYSRGNKFTI